MRIHCSGSVTPPPTRVSGGLEGECLVVSEELGIRSNDILVSIGEKKIRTPEDVVGSVDGLKPGDRVVITVHRGKYGCLAVPGNCIERLLPELPTAGL